MRIPNGNGFLDFSWLDSILSSAHKVCSRHRECKNVRRLTCRLLIAPRSKSFGTSLSLFCLIYDHSQKHANRSPILPVETKVRTTEAVAIETKGLGEQQNWLRFTTSVGVIRHGSDVGMIGLDSSDDTHYCIRRTCMERTACHGV
jgi:hypothetical protein